MERERIIQTIISLLRTLNEDELRFILRMIKGWKS